MILILLLVLTPPPKTTPPPACTCGPTCPTPTAKPWPIPASMEKIR